MNRSALAVLALLISSVASAQIESWDVGVALEWHEPTAWSDTYDAIYGESLVTVGAVAGIQMVRPLSLRLRIGTTEADGQLVAVTPTGEVVPTGTPVDLTLTPIHLTLGYRFFRNDSWEVAVGGGVSVLKWEERTDFFERSESETGLHVEARARYALDPVGVTASLRWSTFSDALDSSGIAARFGDDSMGGVTLGVAVDWRFGRP